MEAYLIHLLIMIFIYIILCVSLDFCLGFGGLLNLGHIAFYGIGAYTSALLVMNGWPFLLAFLAAGMLAALNGLILALPTTRLKGDYLALTTLGFNYIIWQLALNSEFTRGPLGLPGIPKPEIFSWVVNTNHEYLLLTFIIMVVSLVIMNKLVKSSFGRNLEATRDDEIASATLGKNVFMTRAVAFTIAAFFAGIAGSLYAHYITFIDPTVFKITEIILIWSIVIVGGLASTRGAIVGTFILLLLPEPLRFLGLPSTIIGPARQMLFGAILLLILYFRPRGLFGRVDLSGD